jgi:hypothetical protein
MGTIDDLIALVKDDYNNYAFEILLGSPIFITPVYSDMRLVKMSIL